MQSQDYYYLSEGDQVYGIDNGFTETVHEGVVVAVRELDEEYNELDVRFTQDPMNEGDDTPRVISGMSTQFISVDASAQELHDKLAFPAPA